MAETSDTLSKREFLEMTCLIFKEILNPRLLRSAMEAAATKLEIPDAPSIVAKMLAVEKGAGTTGKAGRGKDGGDKKEREKRPISAYNVIVSWVCDYAAHYGKHPDILRVKDENPGVKMGPPFCSKFFELFPERKEPVSDIIKDFLQQHNGGKSEADGAGAGSVLEAFKRYQQTHPEADVGKVLGLEPDLIYKTDPAQMKAEAAEARRHVDGTAWVSTTPAAKQLDFGGAAVNGGAAGTSAAPPAAAEPEPAVGAKTAEKGKGKRKAEGEAAAAVAVAGQAAANGGAEAGTTKKKQKTEDGETKPDKEKKNKSAKKAKAEAEEPKAAADEMDVDAVPKSDKKADKKEKKEKREKGDKSEKHESKEKKEKGDKSEKKEKKKKERGAQDA